MSSPDDPVHPFDLEVDEDTQDWTGMELKDE